MSVPHLGDSGDAARDRGVIDTKLCTRCCHGYRRSGLGVHDMLIRLSPKERL
jgi:hypothetical protein